MHLITLTNVKWGKGLVCGRQHTCTIMLKILKIGLTLKWVLLTVIANTQPLLKRRYKWLVFLQCTQLPLYVFWNRLFDLSDINTTYTFIFTHCTQNKWSKLSGKCKNYYSTTFTKCFFSYYKIHDLPLHGYDYAICIEEYANMYGENSHYTMRNT